MNKNDKRLENLQPNTFEDKQKAKRAAQSKKGMTYYTTKLKEQFVKNKNLKKSLELAQERHAQLLEKSKDDELSDKQIKELNAITNFLNKFLDKTFATQTENKNENHNYENVVINTVQPDDDGK